MLVSAQLKYTTVIALALALALSLFGFVFGARADDSSTGVALPPLKFVGVAAVQQVSIALTGKLVEQNFVILSKEGEGASLTIDTPRFGWLGDAEPYPDRQFPELTLKINGRKATVLSSSKVFVGNKDISADVTAAALDPFTISSSPPIAVSDPGHQAAFDHLVSEGAVKSTDGNFLAVWSAARQLTVPLPDTRKPIDVSVRYMPRPGFKVVPAAKVAEELSDGSFCRAGAESLAAPTLPKTGTLLRQDYSFPVGIKGEGPQAVLFSMDAKDARRGIVAAVCGPDGLVVSRNFPMQLKGVSDSNGTFRLLTWSLAH